MTKGTFGEYLKREREMRGVSLDEIAAATRIAPRFLRAIETEQWDQLPGGVFNRGFVRAVAHYLGLDEESIVAEYGLAVGVHPTVPVWTGSPPAVPPDQLGMVWILAGVIAIVLIAGSWFGVRRIYAWCAARRAAHAAAAVVAPPSAPVAPPETVPTVSNDSAPNPIAIPALTTATSNGNPSPAATHANSAPFKLKIETDKRTWVTVETDAHRVFEGNMTPGAGHTFSAQDQFQVSAGDAGALQLELNGKTLDPIGPPGSAGKVTLKREDLKKATGGKN
jgi:cytoskeleton protein RodZ